MRSGSKELPAVDPRFDPDVTARGAAAVRRFVESGVTRRALWVLEGRPVRVAAAAPRLRRLPEMRARRTGDRLLVVDTPARHPSRLVEIGVLVRSAWRLATPGDR